jgi:hypothetical protein
VVLLCTISSGKPFQTFLVCKSAALLSRSQYIMFCNLYHGFRPVHGCSDDYISQFCLLRRSNSDKFEAIDAVPAEESVVADPFSSTISAFTQSMFISPIRWRHCLSSLMPTVVLVPAFLTQLYMHSENLFRHTNASFLRDTSHVTGTEPPRLLRRSAILWLV